MVTVLAPQTGRGRRVTPDANRARAFVRRHRFASYALVAFAVSWTGVLLVAWSASFSFSTDRAAIPVLLAMLPGPTVAAVAVTALADGRAGLLDLWRRLLMWRLAPRWYAHLLIVPAVVLGVLAGLAWLVDEAYRPELNLAFVLIGLAAGALEEIGWTGVATPALLRRHGPARAGLMLGVVWSGWHVLADAITNDSGYWFPSLWAPRFATVFIVGLIAWRVIMTHVYSRTRSLPLGIAMHGFYTGSIGAFQPATSEGRYVLWTAAMAVVLAVVAAIVVAVRRGVT